MVNVVLMIRILMKFVTDNYSNNAHTVFVQLKIVLLINLKP